MHGCIKQSHTDFKYGMSALKAKILLVDFPQVSEPGSLYII